MRADGTFIAVEVDDQAAGDPELARKLTEACPVDIFAQSAAGALELVEGNLDECVLCRLCLDAAAVGSGSRGQGDQALRQRRRPRLSIRTDPDPRPSCPLSCRQEGWQSMNENFSLIVMCLFLLASLAFLAQQLTSYH